MRLFFLLIVLLILFLRNHLIDFIKCKTLFTVKILIKMKIGIIDRISKTKENFLFLLFFFFDMRPILQKLYTNTFIYCTKYFLLKYKKKCRLIQVIFPFLHSILKKKVIHILHILTICI